EQIGYSYYNNINTANNHQLNGNILNGLNNNNNNRQQPYFKNPTTDINSMNNNHTLSSIPMQPSTSVNSHVSKSN
ncbi:12085_t:CDS:1, partial [Entrophospora sp. SA101]